MEHLSDYNGFDSVEDGKIVPVPEQLPLAEHRRLLIEELFKNKVGVEHLTGQYFFSQSEVEAYFLNPDALHPEDISPETGEDYAA